MDILQILKTKFELYSNVETSLKKSDSEETLLIKFDSLSSIQEVYESEIPFFEAILEIINDFDGPPENFNEILSIRDSEENLEKIQNDPDKLFLVLKYRTNYIDILRKYYEFVYKIISYLGLDNSFEETADGFLHFYRTANNFNISTLNFLNLSELTAFLKKHKLWNKKIEHLLKVIASNMKLRALMSL
jgi:hypothetical protein